MEPTDDPRIGGRYALVRRIARGGGGTVWEAHDDMLDRTVAVKQVEIPDELSDAERERLRRRVLAEARAAARLEHPSVVVMHDVIDGDDTVHLVMEYIEAPTLRELVDRRGPLPEDAAAAIGFGLLDVLTETHRRGVVHRDVKPSNVFVLDDGSVKLGDFGIAALTGEVSLTRTGVALGSPSYLAPEQARGESAVPSADLWGLGATLYYAVEGTAPFHRRTALATVHAVVNEPMHPFERADALRGPVTALLRKDPADRPDAGRIRAELAAVAGIPASAVDEPTAPVAPEAAAAGGDQPPTSRETTGGRGRWLVAALVGLVAVVGVATLADPGADDADEPPLAEAPEETTGDDGGDETGAGGDDDAVDATADEPPDESDEPPDESDEGSDADSDADSEAASGDDDAPTRGESDDGDGADAADPEPDDADDDTDQGADATGTSDGAYVVPETAPPGDWQTVAGETFEVAVPPGWQRREASGNRTDWVEPSTGAYLRVDWTDSPAGDPVTDWEQAEAGFRDRYPSYDRVRLEPARYRNWDAAMWEYTYAPGGSSLQAVNLNILADDLGHAFALNLQAPAGEWDRIASGFPAIAGSFEPTVGG